MEATTTFTLKRPEENSAAPVLESELLMNGQATGRKIPGYVLEAQYRCPDGHLFITSWDSLENSLDVVLTSGDLAVVDRQSVCEAYLGVWLDRHEPLSAHQLLLQCEDGLQVRVTVEDGIRLEWKDASKATFTPFNSLSDKAKKEQRSAARWKFW